MEKKDPTTQIVIGKISDQLSSNYPKMALIAFCGQTFHMLCETHFALAANFIAVLSDSLVFHEFGTMLGYTHKPSLMISRPVLGLNDV